MSQALHEGFPDAALCQAARDLRADLVVVGTHGRTGLRWFFLGSVAAGVVRGCPTDVLVVRGEPAGHGGFRRILVGTDFTPASDAALEHALDLAATGAEVDLVHFIGLALVMRAPAGAGVPLTALPPAPDPVRRALVEGARERLAALVARHARPGASLTAHVLDGAPVPGLVHRLEQRPVRSGRAGRDRAPRAPPARARLRRGGRRAPSALLGAGGARARGRGLSGGRVRTRRGGRSGRG